MIVTCHSLHLQLNLFHNDEHIFTNFFFQLFVSDEEITLDALLVMTEETLLSVVKKAGHRAVLLSKIEQVC